MNTIKKLKSTFTGYKKDTTQKQESEEEQIEFILKTLGLPKKQEVESKTDDFTITNCFLDMEKSFQKLICSKYNSSFDAIEHYISKSSLAENISNDPEKIFQYKSVYGKNFDIRHSNKITINKIVRYLYPELRTFQKKKQSPDSKSLENDTNVIARSLALTKKTVFTNFIYGKNKKTNKFEFVFGKLNRQQLRNKQFILNELGAKHLQLAYGYHLYYSGTCIFTRENEHFSIVVNTRSGQWVDIMEDIIPKLDRIRYWRDILGKYENDKMFKYTVLDLLTIRKVEELLTQYLGTYYNNALRAVKIVHPECYYMNILNLYASTTYNENCTLDVEDIVKKFNKNIDIDII